LARDQARAGLARSPQIESASDQGDEAETQGD